MQTASAARRKGGLAKAALTAERIASTISQSYGANLQLPFGCMREAGALSGSTVRARRPYPDSNELSRCSLQSPPIRISGRSPRRCDRSLRRSAERSNLRPQRSQRPRGLALFVLAGFDSRADAALDEPVSCDGPPSQLVQTRPMQFGGHPIHGQSGLNIQFRDLRYLIALLDLPRRVVQPLRGPWAHPGV
jgi:hypothetical protein